MRLWSIHPKYLDPAGLTVSCGQLDYEFEHLKRKRDLRSPKTYMRLIAVRSIEPHPLFRVTTGGVAVWEIIR